MPSPPQHRVDELVAPVEDGVKVSMPGEVTRRGGLYGTGLVALHLPSRHSPVAEQLEFVGVMLLDGGAVAGR